MKSSNFLTFEESNENRLNMDWYSDKKFFLTDDLRPKYIWFQELFKKDGNVISLVHLGFSDLYYNCPWEIHCNEGNLFSDIERFTTLIEAVLRIKQLLKITKKEFLDGGKK